MPAPKKPDRVISVLPIKGKWRVRYVEFGRQRDHWEESDALARAWAADKTLALLEAAKSPPKAYADDAPPAERDYAHGTEAMGLGDWERLLTRRVLYCDAHPGDIAAGQRLRSICVAMDTARAMAKAKKELEPEEDSLAKMATEELLRVRKTIDVELERRQVALLPPEPAKEQG
jgi:hypothetical protein